MKAILTLIFLSTAFLFPIQKSGMRPSQAAGQTIPQTPAQQEAEQELNKAARSYREGNFAEAQQHSEKAFAVDPFNKTAPLFIARTIHAQYTPGDQNEANIAKAREALDAYKRILSTDPQNEEAYKAIAYLYGSLKEDELLRGWVLERAVGASFSADKRAEAFVVLASKDWDCSFKITELPTNKITELPTNKTGYENKPGSLKIRYIIPKDAAEFEKAHQCAANGLSMIEEAITLAPDSEAAWSYKTNLLLELSKLAEMDNDLALKSDYERQADAAGHTTREISKRNGIKASTKP
jgi:tetratricopeptide (TPR) repeat protein